jgi:anti-sigma regulatory factor (Ser/Thr protein kinase)
MTQAEHARPAAHVAPPAGHVAAGWDARRLMLRIPRRAEEVHRARHWLRICLRDWHRDGAEAAEFVFAEVVSNAFRHSRGRITVTVQISARAVTCGVRDSSLRRPRRASRQDPEPEEGRGMMIITALADAWGVRRHLRGKTVWFEIRAPQRPRTGPARR